MRELLASGGLPESWVSPAPVLEWRERVRLYKSLSEQRRVWTQRIHAELFQHGVAIPEGAIRSEETRRWLAGDRVELTDAARQRVAVGYRKIDATDAELSPLKADLQRFGAILGEGRNDPRGRAGRGDRLVAGRRSGSPTRAVYVEPAVTRGLGLGNRGGKTRSPAAQGERHPSSG